MDSTSLRVCHRRIERNKVFETVAARGRTSLDWFFGFKLHRVVNGGEWLNIMFTPGNSNDRTLVPKLLQQLFGKIFADKGYVSQKLAKQLLKTAGIILGGLIAYCHQPKKPSIGIDPNLLLPA